MTTDASCVACPSGQYQDEDNQTSCKPCYGSNEVVSEDKTACYVECGTVGIYESNGVCYNCPTGQYQDQVDQTSCKTCSACAKGKYGPSPCLTTQDTVCYDCPTDTFADQTGLTECKACPEGKQQPATGYETCVCGGGNCHAGKEAFTEQLLTTTSVTMDYQGSSYTESFYATHHVHSFGMRINDVQVSI